jgi:hypothetical protein
MRYSVPEGGYLIMSSIPILDPRVSHLFHDICHVYYSYIYIHTHTHTHTHTHAHTHTHTHTHTHIPMYTYIHMLVNM